MIGLFALLAIQAAVEPPRTINGIELGAPEDFATPGPATVCIGKMMLSPRAGETAYLTYAGIHNGGLRLVLADGEQVEFILGDIFLDQTRSRQGPLFQIGEMRAYLIEHGPEMYYQIHGRIEVDEGKREWQPLINVDGSGLGGNRLDRDIFRRLSLAGNDETHCDRRYNFGWGVILQGEPIDTTGAP